jgi:hypothetical protein
VNILYSLRWIWFSFSTFSAWYGAAAILPWLFSRTVLWRMNAPCVQSTYVEVCRDAPGVLDAHDQAALIGHGLECADVGGNNLARRPGGRCASGARELVRRITRVPKP